MPQLRHAGIEQLLPVCGQQTALHPLSVWAFAREIVSHYVALEGKLRRTLGLLTLQPGRLTKEFLAGRRQRYIVPLRLYLSASFFFAVNQWMAPALPVSASDRRSSAGAKQPSDRDEAARGVPVGPGPGDAARDGADEVRKELAQVRAAMPNLRWEPCLSAPATCPFWQRHIAPTIVKLQRDPEPVTARFAERFGHSPSYAMFLLLPIFAWFLALVYRSRKMYHGEHLVFSPHLHSVSFLLATFFLLLPQALGLGLPPWFVAYGLWAMHRVYGGPWRLAILRGATVTALSGLVLGLGAAALSLVLLAT